MSKGVSKRVSGEVFVRSASEEGYEEMVIEGYAAKFDTWSVNLNSSRFGKFKERIEKGAFKDADMSDVPVLVNHDENLIVGRHGSGNTELKVDEVGLYFKVKLPNTTVSKDLYENVSVGNITKCSFRFLVPDGGLSRDKVGEDGLEQIISKISKVLDVSLVTSPAYEDTAVLVAQRSIDNFEKELEQEGKRREIKSKLASLRLEMLREEVRDEY